MHPTSRHPHRSSLRRASAALLRIAGSLAVAIWLLAFSAAAANAAPYAVVQCAAPASGTYVGIDPAFTGTFTGSTTDRCGSGGGYVLTAPFNTLAEWGTNGQTMGFQWTVPASMPNARILAVDEILSVSPKTSADTTLSYGDLRIVGDGATWGDFIGIPASNWPGVSKLRWQRSGAGARNVQSWMYCYAPCRFADGGTMVLDAASITVDDPIAPSTITPQLTGPLDGGVHARGQETIVLSAADADSGLRQLQVRDASGRVLGATTDGANCAGNRVAACPQQIDRAAISVDLSGLADGTHGLQAVAVDWAGNRKVLALPAIQIGVRASTGSPNGEGGDPSTGRLVPDRKRTKTTVAYRSKVRLAGKLVDATGKPISNATLQTWATVQGGARTKIGELTTDARGAYAWAHKPGSTRLAEITYDPFAGATDRRSTQQLAIAVRAGLTFALTRSRIAARGTAEARGQVRVEGGVPKGGVVVEVRARAGKRWLSGGVVRTTSSGRYTWRHRFGIARGAYLLQARVLRDADMPALPAASRSVRLRIGR